MEESSHNENAQQSELITNPCKLFLVESRNIALFLSSTLDLAVFFDKLVIKFWETGTNARKIVSDVLANSEPSAQENMTEKQKRELKLILDSKEIFDSLDFIGKSGPHITNILSTHKQLLLELILCRSVDNFLTYISELLALLYRTKPETLRSNETEKLANILQHKTMEELISYLTEKKVNELAYKGLKDLSEHLVEKLKFHLFLQEDNLNRAIKIVELRNIIVHNRAKINERFLSRLPDFSANLGEVVILEQNEVIEDIKFLRTSVKDIDNRAVNKFSLPTSAISSLHVDN